MNARRNSRADAQPRDRSFHDPSTRPSCKFQPNFYLLSSYFLVEEWSKYPKMLQGDALTNVGDIRDGITAKQMPSTAELDNWSTEPRLPKTM
jgi:hypothetical protein